MTWEQRYRLHRAARTSLVLWAGLALVAALVAAPTVLWLDGETNWKLFRFSPDGARAVLGALAGSMLTFIVFVLSATLIVVQLASGQSSPRVIALVLESPGIKLALAVLAFTYTYTLGALGRIEGRVPDLHVSIAVFLNLACIVVFLMFVQRLATDLRPVSLIRLVADRARPIFHQVYPLPYDPTPAPPAEQKFRPTPTQVVEVSGRSGAVMAFGTADLVRLAAEADAVVELVPQVGDFVAVGDPLIRVFGGARAINPAALRGCIAVGPERTLEQDPRFVFRILVDIASKALSPAINDPTTAVQALDQIEHLLLALGRRHLDDRRACDKSGKLRVVYGTPNWPDYVILAVSEVRQFGAASLQVNRRLRAMLEHLLGVLPDDRRPPLREELAMLSSSCDRSFQDEADRRRARIADFQGIGGSGSES